jgi:hypothetical protein
MAQDHQQQQEQKQNYVNQQQQQQTYPITHRQDQKAMIKQTGSLRQPGRQPPAGKSGFASRRQQSAAERLDLLGQDEQNQNQDGSVLSV